MYIKTIHNLICDCQILKCNNNNNVDSKVNVDFRQLETAILEMNAEMEWIHEISVCGMNYDLIKLPEYRNIERGTP